MGWGDAKYRLDVPSSHQGLAGVRRWSQMRSWGHLPCHYWHPGMDRHHSPSIQPCYGACHWTLLWEKLSAVSLGGTYFQVLELCPKWNKIYQDWQIAFYINTNTRLTTNWPILWISLESFYKPAFYMNESIVSDCSFIHEKSGKFGEYFYNKNVRRKMLDRKEW